MENLRFSVKDGADFFINLSSVEYQGTASFVGMESQVRVHIMISLHVQLDPVSARLEAICISQLICPQKRGCIIVLYASLIFS